MHGPVMKSTPGKGMYRTNVMDLVDFDIWAVDFVGFLMKF